MQKNLFLLFLILAFTSIAATQTAKKKPVAAPPPKNPPVVDNNQISFSTYFLDSLGKISFIYPTAIPNATALLELQKNFIKQQFGEKFLEMEPAQAFSSYVSQNEDIKSLSGEVSFPLPGIVQFQSANSNVGIYSFSDGKKIELSSLFLKNWEKDVAKLIIKEFLFVQNLQSLADHGYTDKESDFVPTSARLSASGMEFVFPANQITHAAAGEQNVFLSWNTLKPYLNKKSAIYSKIKF